MTQSCVLTPCRLRESSRNRASWSSEPIVYDPDSPDWGIDDDDVDEDGDDDEVGRAGGIG